MFNIGIIGAESKHCTFFSQIINVDKPYRGYAVRSLWGGDAPEKIPQIQKDFGIERVCESYEELIDVSDAVMVIQRRGSEHFLPARLAIEAGKPVFVDKPFTSDCGEAQALVSLAEKKGVPVTGGTTLKFLPEVMDIKRLAEKEKPDTVLIRYLADEKSEYDGFNFYGSHLAELCVWICGGGYSKLKALKNADGALACLSYPDIKAVISATPCLYGLEIALLSRTPRSFKVDEAECYRRGMDAFIGMLETGVPPVDYSYFTSSVRLAADIIKSLDQ